LRQPVPIECGLRLSGGLEVLPNPQERLVRISAIVDAHFRLIVDGKSAPSETRRGGAQVLG
jgi:hypothetical protein